MLPWKILSISVVFLYFASLVNSSNIRTIKFNKTVNSTIFSELVHDKSHFQQSRGSSWSYALCKKKKPRESSTWCSVVLENNKPDGRTYRSVCQLVLNNPNDENDATNSMRVFLFGTNKSVVLWYHERSIHFYTVHFPNCRINDATIAINEKLLTGIIPAVHVLSNNDDKYDVFYANLTDKFTWNKITFDENSKVIAGPMALITSDVNNIPRIPLWMKFTELPAGFGTSGHIVTASSQITYELYWQTDDKLDEKKELWSTNFNSEEFTQLIYFSTANGIFGMSKFYPINKTIVCEQFNAHRVKILHVSFNIGYDVSDIRSFTFKMHNLRGGGFLLFFWPDTVMQQKRELYVTKVDANGTRYMTLYIMSDNSVEGYPIYTVREGYFENGPDKYCWYQMTGKERDSMLFYEITYNCFTDEQLSEQYV